MKLKIKGKEYQLEWGMRAIEIYCDKMDCDIDDIDIHLASTKLIDQMRAINNLTLAAIQNGCENSSPKVEFDVSYNDYLSFLDNNPEDTSTKIIEDWKQSYFFGKKVAEHFFGQVEETDSKKPKKKIASVK